MKGGRAGGVMAVEAFHPVVINVSDRRQVNWMVMHVRNCIDSCVCVSACVSACVFDVNQSDFESHF